MKAPGRCKTCWGGLVGRSNEARELTGIKCRVCGTKLEGKDAANEEKRMTSGGDHQFTKYELGALSKVWRWIICT